MFLEGVHPARASAPPTDPGANRPRKTTFARRRMLRTRRRIRREAQQHQHHKTRTLVSFEGQARRPSGPPRDLFPSKQPVSAD